ncbi:MAG: hypothetical protein LWW94_04225 [Candidatus Desulfofervidaceae bacterium]|nr:hypothetical protein [Candidatus Desulfofervidaceae bacterium]
MLTDMSLEAKPSFLGFKAGLGFKKRFESGSKEEEKLRHIYENALKVSKLTKDSKVQDFLRSVAKSSSDAETSRKAAEVAGTFMAVSEMSQKISDEFKQADALEKMSRNEEAIKQVLGTDPRHLFEKHLVQKYGIEGTKELLQKSLTDENARQKVTSEYRAFISDYVRRHSSTLAEKGYVDPNSVKIKAP